MYFPITSLPSPPPLHPQHQRGSGAAPPTRRGAAVGWRRRRRRRQATSPSSTGRMRRRAPTSAGGGGVPGRDARPSQGAATQPDVLRRRDVMAAGAPDGVVSRADSFRLAGRLVRRRGAAAVRAAPKHGRCERWAVGRRRGVDVGQRAARGGLAARQAR